MYNVCPQLERDDSEDVPEDGCEGEGESLGEEGRDPVGVRSSDGHASYFRDGGTRVDYVLVYEVGI